MKRFIKRSICILMFAAGLSNGQAGVVVKANNSDNLNLGTSWTGGVAPTSSGLVQWDSTVTAAKTVSLGSNQSWLGLSIIDPVGGITFNTGNTLTLGASGIVSSPNLAMTLNSPITLGTAQTWSIAANTFVLGGGVNTAGFPLTLAGAGLKQFKGDITGSGTILLSSGETKLSTGAKATNSAVTANPGATLTFDTATNAATAARTDAITLNGATLSVGGLSGTNSVETNTHALTIGPGASMVTIAPNSARNTQLVSGSFSRVTGGTVLFRGANLGTYPIATGTANSANLVFTTSPTLVGGGGASGSTTMGIIPGARGDTSSNGLGAGLVTYDTTNGVRLLNAASEYKPSITNAQTQLDNVLLANSSGIQVSSTISSSTTINSLSFAVSSSSNSGITIIGTGTLKLNSGMIWASDTIGTSTAADSMVIALPLDLNGKEGSIHFSTTNTGGGGNGGGLLELSEKITNDGGNGVTFSGNGVVKLSGSAASTYTGPTTLNAGNLYLAKNGTYSIPGNLVINGGNVIDPSNQVKDTADITINGGQLAQKSSLNSGSGSSETFHDLLMTGGSYSDGAGGTSSGATSLHNATLTGGAWSVTLGHKTTLSGSMAISNGGTLSISEADSAGHTTIVTINSGLAIGNAPAGAYTPISIRSSSTNAALGGQLILLSNVSFTGNSSNANTVTIDASTPTGTGNYGTIALVGTQTFNIGDGAAADDLTIKVPLADGTIRGGVTKLGAGTLVLAGNNTFTGLTSVNAGGLRLSGSSIIGGIMVGTALLDAEGSLFSNGSLVLNNASQMILGQTVSFDGLTIGSTVLAPGIYPYATLHSSYPAIFVSGSSGAAIINRGATWYVSADQTAGHDWNEAAAWTYNANGTGLNPFNVNVYDSFQTNGHVLRTGTTDSTFAGGTLILVANSTLGLVTANGSVSTVPNLFSTGGTISNLATSNYSQQLVVDNFTISSGTTTLSAPAGKGINLSVGNMSGGGNLNLSGGGTFKLDFPNAADYVGTVILSSGTLDFEVPASGNPLSTQGGLQINAGTKVLLNDWVYFTSLSVSGTVFGAGPHSAASLGLSGTGSIMVYAADLAGPPQMFGVNLAGAEFGNNVPGVYGTDYAYPVDAEFAYYQSKGLNFIRVPFKWERVQRSLFATLDATEMGRMDAVVGFAHKRGMKVLLDMHNYVTYSGTGLGTSPVTYAAYNNVWSQLADRYKNETAVYGYDIMNEPSGAAGTFANWSAAAQSVVNAIRQKDTSHYIFVEGISYSGAQGWLANNGDLDIKDPVDRIVYSAHSYWDSNYQNWSTNWKFDGNYGTYTQEAGSPDMGVTLMTDFVNWLHQHGFHGHIGEFGVPNTDSANWNTVLDHSLSFLRANGVSGTYWAGGPRWGAYALSCEPTSNYTVDAPQMSVLKNYTGALFSSWKLSYFTPTEIANPAISGALANPTGDGTCNLMDYAFGLKPTISNGRSALPQTTSVNGQLTLTYQRNKTASDLAFTVEVSGDLKTWNSGTTYTSTPTVLSDDGFIQTLKASDLAPASSKTRFIRLRVTGP